MQDGWGAASGEGAMLKIVLVALAAVFGAGRTVVGVNADPHARAAKPRSGGADRPMALRLSGRRLAAAVGFAVAGAVGMTAGVPAQALSPEDLATLRQEYR